MKTFFKISFVFFFLNLNSVWAVDEFQNPRVLDNPRYPLTHKAIIDLGFGELPLDAFYKDLTLEAAVSTFLSDFFGWEIGRVKYSIWNHKTSLPDSITEQTGYPVNDDTLAFKHFNFQMSSGPVMNLLYSKSNFFNRAIIYHHWTLGIGPTYLHFKRTSQFGMESSLIGRIYFSKNWASYIRASYTQGFFDAPGENMIDVGAGGAFVF